MKKNVLLIEDRYVRQKYFIDETNINLDNYTDILDNYTNELYDELELQIQNDTFNFDKYDYIIAHKSAFGKRNNEFLSKLQEYCTKYDKTLVLFSGGISTNYYDKTDFEILELNSKTFYSENLELFLESIRNNNENVLMLCYGQKWKQNIVSNTIEKVNLFINSSASDDLDYNEFINKVDIKKVENFFQDIYTVQTEDGWVYLSEIKKFRDSLYKCFSTIDDIHSGVEHEHKKSLLIHNNNIVELEEFDHRIKFTPNVTDIDEYISEEIIFNIQKQECDIIFIKDNLSSNYLELYGIRVAYHIRLSESLENKRYIPIVILSDFEASTLNKIEPMANILLTKNIFLIDNNQESIEKIKNTHLKNLTPEEYQDDFLDKIEVNQPKDYLTHHSIANEWSIYRWANYLDVNTPEIQKVRSDISSMLYFKYLQAKYPIKRSLFAKQKQEINGVGKILYIDDEWQKGWGSIFENLSSENENYSLKTVKEIYKDKTQEEIISFVMKKIFDEDPDVVILDMRLHENDFSENVGFADFTGIQIFNLIKEVNPGIQIIIFTASSNSLLLDEISNYDGGFLGYVKKEHPKNYNLTTQGNINKLINLLNTGLDEKYLKGIYVTKKQILEILENDIFSSYIQDVDKYEQHWFQIKKEANHIFDILNSNTSNKYPYAMLSIARSLEAVLSIFIVERQIDIIYWDSEIGNSKKFEDKITGLMKKLGYEISNLNSFITRRNRYIHSNPSYIEVTKIEIEQWFKILLDILNIINNPPNYIPYTAKVKKHHNFKKDS